MKTIDRAIISKKQPNNRNVAWFDTSHNVAQLRIPQSGKWLDIGSNTTDIGIVYCNMEQTGFDENQMKEIKKNISVIIKDGEVYYKAHLNKKSGQYEFCKPPVFIAYEDKGVTFIDIVFDHCFIDDEIDRMDGSPYYGTYHVSFEKYTVTQKIV